MSNQLIELNRKVVLNVHGKSEEDLKKDIEHINEWLKKQPHLPHVDESRIEFILNRRKFSLERTKRNIETFYTIKHYIPELFDKWDPLSADLQASINVCSWLVLEKLTPDYDRISIFRTMNNDPEKLFPWLVQKFGCLITELRVIYNDLTVSEQFIFDLSGLTMSHFTKYTPSMLKKFKIVFQDAYAIRLRAIHLLWAPPSVEQILSIVKVLLSPKVFARIHFHKDLESLHKMVPRELLPKEYGGDEPPFQESLQKWVTETVNYRDELIKQSKIRSDESKRIDDLPDMNILGSMHGSFRKLQLD